MMERLSKTRNFESRSISAENYRGEKGKGGMATEGTGASCARDLGRGWKVSPSVVIKSGEMFEAASIDGPGIIKHIWMTHSVWKARKLVIRIYWDNSETPSVEAPLNDFFAYGDPSEFSPLSSLAVCVNPRAGYNCYWEMPFYKHCRISVENISDEDIVLYYQIDYVLGEIETDLCYFHAQFRRVNPLPYKEVYTILDNVRGRGHYVGTYMLWGVNNNSWWGEGEIKFYLDGDKDYPTICGTGTEDYFCGAYGFEVDKAYREYCTPYAGLSQVTRQDGLYRTNQRFSVYRWHITDPIYFKKDIKVTIQALGWRSGGRYLPLQDDISSVSYWYQDSICKTFPKFPTPDELELI